MRRFEMFLRIREQLENKMDYLFFFNANMEFLAPVGEDILPTEKDNEMIGALHSWYFDQYKWNYPYERRRLSSAFIPYWIGKHYFQGSLLGGTTSAFLKMCETCNRWIDLDLLNNLIPIWHDESMVNKYFLLYPPKILDCRYNYCERRNLPIEKKILYKDKTKYFSFENLKRPPYTVFPKMPWYKIIWMMNQIDRLCRKVIRVIKYKYDSR